MCPQKARGEHVATWRSATVVGSGAGYRLQCKVRARLFLQVTSAHARLPPIQPDNGEAHGQESHTNHQRMIPVCSQPRRLTSIKG